MGLQGVSHEQVPEMDSRIAGNGGFVRSASDDGQRRDPVHYDWGGGVDNTQCRRRYGTVFQMLAPGSELHASQTVRTGDAGKADLGFVDRTNLTVGPTSEVVLDKFVYDPVGNKGKVVLQATRGAFRFVTGTKITAPTSSIRPMGRLACVARRIPAKSHPKEKKSE